MGIDKIPVIIDTDIGDDIDDSFAICLAMRSPEIELIGVTTVFKNTLCRAKIVKRFLTLGGFENVPVYAGSVYPLCTREVYNNDIKFDEKPISYTDDFDKEKIDTSIDGAEFIIRTLEKSERPVVIVTLGALTNIAEVLRRRPDLKNKIDFISMMGGAYIRNFCEYNYTCDPDAADLVICSGIKIQAVGLDVTFQCKPSQEQLKMLEQHNHPCIKMLIAMRHSWGHDVFLHDPLALAAVYNKGFLTFAQNIFRVETKGQFSRGMAVNIKNYNMPQAEFTPPVEIAVDVKADEFVNHCVNRLLSY